MKFLMIAAILLVNLSSLAYASDKAKIERASAAIKTADEAVIVMIYGLSECEKANEPMNRHLWSIYRDQTVSAIQKIFKDRNKALIRFDDIYKQASNSPNNSNDGDACIYMLDQFKHELDVAIAHMQESFK